MNVKSEMLTLIANKANEMKYLESEITNLKRLTEQLEHRHNEISNAELPELMAQVGMMQFKLMDGTELAVKPVMKVSITKAKMDEADEWLRENGHTGLVKTSIFVDRNVSNELLEHVVNSFKDAGVDLELSKTIHHQTLNKWAREMEEESIVIPEEIFSVYRSTKTVIV